MPCECGKGCYVHSSPRKNCRYVTSDWKTFGCFFPRTSISGKKIKGRIYKRAARALEQNGHYVYFREYADAKEIFKQKLKGTI